MSESLQPEKDELACMTSNAELTGKDVNGRESEPQKQLSRLYHRYFDSLVKGLRATYGSGPPEPEDIAQRTFAKMNDHESLNGIGNLEGYIWIAARNLMLTEIRALGVRSRYAAQEKQNNSNRECDDFDPERVLIAREELQIVMQTLEKMPERRRNIFFAKRFEGLSAEAAGRKYGVSRSSAVRHIAVATAEISEALGRFLPPKNSGGS
ncbi:MAG: sigma-70 family RNA polymerase sigma factor [Pseudomonadota bacterium]